MTLEEHINSLPKRKQFELTVKLTKLASPIWSAYTQGNELSYRDTIVGLLHQVNKEIVHNTIKAVEDYLALSEKEKVSPKSKVVSWWTWLSGDFFKKNQLLKGRFFR